MYSNELFPPIEPYAQGSLKVSDLHTLYYEECGNPDGKPLVLLHGGPGGGTSPLYRLFADPSFYRIILFDQRGSGKSTPYAEIRENDTWSLVADIEKLRNKLNIDKWMVMGGSWGTTLGLCYAIKHPESVQAMILTGVFLSLKLDYDWFFKRGGISSIFPEQWEQFESYIPEEERSDLISAFHKRLNNPDPAIHLPAAQVWNRWEHSVSMLIPQDDDTEDNAEAALAVARIECEYFINNCFLPSENYILENIDKIRHIPCRVSQGRYDLPTPFVNTWELKKAWPEIELRIVPDAGHLPVEPGHVHEIIQASEDFKKLY